MGRKPNNKNTNLPKKSSIKKEETSLNLNDSANPSSPSNSIKLLQENKPKKKRGRKPKVLTEEELRIKNQPKIHKKRGRKPKEKFNFDLISDPDETICKQYDVIKEKSMYGRKYMGVERSTFLIDSKGKLVREWRKVKVTGHAEEVLEAAKDLASQTG